MKILLLLAFLGVASAAQAIEPKLLSLIAGTSTNVMITLANRTDSILAALTTQVFASRTDQLNAVASALQAHAALNQAGVLQILSTFTSIQVTPYWISNQIFVTGANSAVISALQSLPDVASVEQEFFVPFGGKPAFTKPVLSTRQNGVNTNGVQKVQAPNVWALGYNGTGVVVANIDTGVRLTHVALAGRFIGTYGWYDPYLRTTSPNDQDGHGTHTMGTMTGTGGIGVAPGATWMACKGCTTAGCSNNQLTSCGQFMTCPTRPGFFGLGTTSNCSKAPHVINNSWGGAGGSNWYNSVINAWNTAGIIGVFSAGNSGGACGTMNSPGDQPNVIAVGATDSNDALASYSSVGPNVNGTTKPDISAPGSAVISSWYTSNTATATLSGTSMASPHVAGVVALLKSKKLTLTYANIYQYLTANDDQAGLSTTPANRQSCGNLTATQWPNNFFGYGRVNALKSILAF